MCHSTSRKRNIKATHNKHTTFLVAVAKPLQREGQRYLDLLIDVNVSGAVGDGAKPGLLALDGLLRRPGTQHDALEDTKGQDIKDRKRPSAEASLWWEGGMLPSLPLSASPLSPPTNLSIPLHVPYTYTNPHVLLFKGQDYKQTPLRVLKGL